MVGFKWTVTGDTLSDPQRPVALEAIEFPDPVISVAIEAKSSADQEKMLQGLQHLVREDPSSRLGRDPETGQLLLSGMGELHLEILLDRLFREFKMKANVGSPQVTYRESISVPAFGRARFDREVAGKSVEVEVGVQVEPLERGGGLQVEVHLPGDFAESFLESARAGVREAMENGILAGFQMVDIGAKIQEISFEEDSARDIGFRVAASQALREALKGAQPVLLEPIFRLDIQVPEEFLGGVIGDLQSRRGKVLSMEVRGEVQWIRAEAPLASLFGYATDLRSISQGRGTFSMEFQQYLQVPDRVAREVLGKMGRF